jgi:hypothetical protein
MKYFALTFVALTSLLLAGCDKPSPTAIADKEEQTQTEDITAQGAAQVPLPTITNFATKRTLKMAYEAQDKQVPTYTYHFSQMHNCYVPMGGDEHTFGYPVPFATQMTNPQKFVKRDCGQYFCDQTTAQADPDTTFKPASADATLIVQLNPATSKNEVTYSEPKVFTRTAPIDPKWICKPNQ